MNLSCFGTFLIFRVLDGLLLQILVDVVDETRVVHLGLGGREEAVHAAHKVLATEAVGPKKKMSYVGGYEIEADIKTLQKHFLPRTFSRFLPPALMDNMSWVAFIIDDAHRLPANEPFRRRAFTTWDWMI